MKTIAMSLAGLVLLGAAARAQTIVGESTYEDNYLHTPPPATAAPPPAPAPARDNIVVPPSASRPAPADQRR